MSYKPLTNINKTEYQLDTVDLDTLLPRRRLQCTITLKSGESFIGYSSCTDDVVSSDILEKEAYQSAMVKIPAIDLFTMRPYKLITDIEGADIKSEKQENRHLGLLRQIEYHQRGEDTPNGGHVEIVCTIRTIRYKEFIGCCIVDGFLPLERLEQYAYRKAMDNMGVAQLYEVI
jgi:hypothetical protein